MNLDVIIIIVGTLFSALMIAVAYRINKSEQPRQLWLLFFTEMWERFSFYGMRALLILYMVNVLGYKDEVANLQYGAYNALVYTLPVVGGMIADRLLGFRKTIVLGGILMAIGHLVLAVPMEQTFFLGLGFLISGNGFFKPNISSFLGRFYETSDPRKDTGYSIFYMGINIGAFLGSALCGYLGQKVNWHLGFGIAGIFMIVGLLTFLAFKKMLEDKGHSPVPDTIEKKTAGVKLEYWLYLLAIVFVPVTMVLVQRHRVTEIIMMILGALTIGFILFTSSKEERAGMQKLWAALCMIVFSVLFWGFYEQSGGSLNLMAERNVNFKTGDKQVNTILAKPVVIAVPFEAKPDSFIATKQRVLTVADVSSFKVGNELSLKSGEQYEINLRVDSINAAANELILEKPVKYNWPPGAELRQIGVLSSAMMNNCVNPFYIILLTPFFGLMWDFMRKRKFEPNTPAKFGWSFVLVALGYFIFFAGGISGIQRGDGLMPLVYFMFAYFFITMGELFMSPIGLSMVTKLSPAKSVGFIMGAWFLASGFGHLLAGWIGSLMAIPEAKANGAPYNVVEALPIYMNGCNNIAIVSLVAGVLILLFSFVIKKWMHGVK